MQRKKTHKMVMCALFAALTAILSQIVIPIGPIPINLATFAVFISGALLGSKLGALSLLIFALLGAFGVPVFAMFRSGLDALLGPTGGYIIGYIPAAFITGFIIEKRNKNNKTFIFPIAMLGGMITYLTLGTAWFMFLMNMDLYSSLMICVIPFLPGEFIKIAVATIIVKRLLPTFIYNL
jgi:biotin transport system substrate-specific component